VPITPPTSEPVIQYTAADIIHDALIEVGISSPGDVDDPDTAQWAFRKLNYLTDVWAAKQAYVWAQQFNEFTLVVGLLPHTIGPAPGATFATKGPRPVRIISSNYLLNTGAQPQGGLNIVDQPMNIQDAEWWAANQTKNIQTNYPTDVYYQPDTPNGSLYFWPTPNTASQVRLQYWQQLSQYSAITDPLSGPGGNGTLPEAYRAALMLSLAESLQPGSEKEPNEQLGRMALEARTAIFANNAKSPRIQTRDYGMPGARSGRSEWNYLTGGQVGGPPE
jgi:hypothetical protein